MCIYEPAAGAKLGYLKVRARHSKNSKSRNVPLTARVVEMLNNLGRIRPATYSIAAMGCRSIRRG